MTDKGIGNGTSIIIMVGILARLPQALVQEFSSKVAGEGGGPILFLIDPFNDRFLWPSLVFVLALVLAARSLWQARPAPLAALPEGTAR